MFLNSHLLTEVERVCDRVAIFDRGRVIATGRPRDLVSDAGVRVRVTGVDRARDVASRFGPVTDETAGLRVGCSPADVPDLVAALVAAGGRVHAVEPLRTTLEDRFLELVTASSG